MNSGILAAGNWIVDRVKMVDRWPGEGELCNIVGQKNSGGGGPCNVLFDLAAMDCGIPLYAAGVIGQDSEGDLLLRKLRENGIDGRYMSVSDSASTSYTDVMTVRTTGCRTFFHCRGANAEFGLKHLQGANVPARLFYLGYLLLLDELDKADSEFGTVGARVLSSMIDKGYKTVVDIVTEDKGKFQQTVLPALRYVDYLIINEFEAAACKGATVRRPDGSLDLDEVLGCVHYLQKCGVRERVVVHFPEGAIALDKDGQVYQQGSCCLEPAEIVGAVGAGDAFCAGMLYAIHEGLPTVDALKVASASAWFNLHAATASDGAPTIAQINEHLTSSAFNQLEAR